MTVTKTVIPVVLCGGAGSRLWPASRQQHPKPFMTLPDGDTLIAKTIKRALALPNIKDLMLVTNRTHYFALKDEVGKVLAQLGTNCPAQHYVLEPQARNTAAAIAAATLQAQALYGDDAILLIMPADHLIEQRDQFQLAVQHALSLAKRDQLVTFGIKPTSPETGFGYIKAKAGHFDEHAQVESFVEKPDLPTAQRYVASGNYLWNAGIFCFSVRTMLTQMQQHCGHILDAVAAAFEQGQRSTFAMGQQIDLDPECFAQVPSQSIDYAVFECSQVVSVVPCDLGWQDIGSWLAWSKLLPQDQHANHTFGKVSSQFTRNSILYSEHAMIAALGVEDLIVVQTETVVLVAHKQYEQDIGQLVQTLEEQYK